MTTLYTIGHSNLPFETFYHHLQRHDIHTLVDVRSQPYSRYVPHFNKASLETSLATITYRFAGQYLGGKGITDYLQRMTEADFVRGMARLMQLSVSEAPVAIMCSEGDPLQCHRHHLIARALIDPAVRVFEVHEGDFQMDVQHITRDGELLPPLSPADFA